MDGTFDVCKPSPMRARIVCTCMTELVVPLSSSHLGVVRRGITAGIHQAHSMHPRGLRDDLHSARGSLRWMLARGINYRRNGLCGVAKGHITTPSRRIMKSQMRFRQTALKISGLHVESTATQRGRGGNDVAVQSQIP